MVTSANSSDLRLLSPYIFSLTGAGILDVVSCQGAQKTLQGLDVEPKFLP